ncbi:MAG: hypothetical protein VB140_04055 [Burkholderia sp.]
MLHQSSMKAQWNGLRTSLVRNLFISPKIIDHEIRDQYARRCHYGLALDLCNNAILSKQSPMVATAFLPF